MFYDNYRSENFGQSNEGCIKTKTMKISNYGQFLTEAENIGEVFVGKANVVGVGGGKRSALKIINVPYKAFICVL